MRKLLITGAMLFAAVPVLAQPPIYEDDPIYGDEMAEEISDAVADPRMIGEVAGTMDRLVGAVMDLPIGGIARAIDPYGRSGYLPGDTVRDMAERDDPFMEERLRAGIHGSTRSIGVMSEALARMIPVFERSLAEMERGIAEALDETRYGARR